MAANHPANPDFAAKPIHYAIDHLTSIKLNLQRLRRRVAVIGDLGLLAELDLIDAALTDLGATMLDIRDHNGLSGTDFAYDVTVTARRDRDDGCGRTPSASSA